MTLEERIMGMINEVHQHPYQQRIRYFKRKYRLEESTILRVIAHLNLEIKGHKEKNKRREVETHIKNNPNKTAKEISLKTGASLFIVYDVARKICHRLENDWTRRAKRIAGKSIYPQ